MCKDEALARVFAEKSATRGEREGEFAMGYYCEVRPPPLPPHRPDAAQVGIGAPGHATDLDAARAWYARAADKGSAEARKRLDALAQGAGAALGRREHERLAQSTLVRKRTQARDEAWSAGRKAAVLPPAESLSRIAEDVRVAHAPAQGPGTPGQGAGLPGPGAGLPGPGQGAGLPGQGHGPGTPTQGPGASVAPLQPQRRPQKEHTAPPQQQRFSLSDPGAGVAGSPMAIAAQAAAAHPSPPAHAQQGGRVRVPIRLDDPAPASSPVSPHAQSPHAQSPLAQNSTLAPTTAGPGPGKITPTSSPRPGNAKVQRPSAPAQQPPPPKKGPATFQEMGFQSQKLDERECVIM